jgi:hypothetical protein
MVNKKNLSDPALIVMGLVFIAAVFYILPFTTNDGPIHVAFSHFLSRTGPSGDLAFQLYRKSGPLYTNQTVYLILPFLMRFLSFGAAEAVIQAVCLVGPPAAAYFALRQIGKDKTWLTLFIFPLALNHLFFLGLYNFCFSVIGFFLAIGSFLWMQKSPSPWRILAPVGALYFAFLSHAAGFIAATIAVSTLTLVSCVLSFKQGKGLAQVIKEHGRHVAMFAALLPLVFLMLGQDGGDARMKYGLNPLSRLIVMLRLRVIYVHSIADMLAALALSAILCVGVFKVAALLYRKRQTIAEKSLHGPLAALALVLMLGLLALVFPDTLGGGWTHFERMALFPFLAAPLCLAYLPIEKRARTVLAAVTAAATLVILLATVWAQSNMQKQIAPLAQVDRIIGRHCSVVPLVFGAKLAGEGINYNPLQHVISRLEYHDDRIVLFNFLARLSVYPVHFQEGRDTQAKLFKWRPQEQDASVNVVDIAGYENSSGLKVDYILQWGSVDGASAKLRRQLPEIMQDSRLVYRSADGQIRLFMRAPDERSRCTSRSSAGAPDDSAALQPRPAL